MADRNTVSERLKRIRGKRYRAMLIDEPHSLFRNDWFLFFSIFSDLFFKPFLLSFTVLFLNLFYFLNTGSTVIAARIDPGRKFASQTTGEA